MSTAVYESELLTVAEAADMLGVSRITVRRRIRDGTLPAVQLGGAGHALRVSRVALYRHLYGEAPVELRHTYPKETRR